jgi:hypothetical protein
LETEIETETKETDGGGEAEGIEGVTSGVCRMVGNCQNSLYPAKIRFHPRILVPVNKPGNPV